MQNNPPQIGIDFNKGRQAKAQWKQAVAKAADNVAFWDAVSGIINQQSAEQTTQEAQPIAQQESSQETADSEPQPIGRGVFGDIYDQFRGKAKEAIAFLLGKKSGEAVGALHHKDVGDISLVYGDGKYGMKKIAEKHPEVLANLQQIIDGMSIETQSDNRIVLNSPTHRAVISKKLGETNTPNWLLTAYEKKSPVSASSSDIETEPEGKRNGTATPQNETLGSKDNTTFSEKQAAEEKTSQENISPDAQLATEATIMALTDSGIDVVQATDEMAEAMLGNSAEMLAKKRRALETASVQEEHQPTVVSSADATKVLNNLDNVATEYEEKSNQPKTLPQIGINFNKGRQAKAEWKQAVAKAADNVAFWDAVSGIINQQSAEQTTQEAQSAQQEQSTEQGTTESIAQQQTELDQNGLPFVVSSNGTTTFGEITEDTGLPSAPIKLSVGNSSYGLQHIEARHGDQIRKAGFNSVEEFVKFVAENYDRTNVKQGNSRSDGSETYLIQIVGLPRQKVG